MKKIMNPIDFNDIRCPICKGHLYFTKSKMTATYVDNTGILPNTPNYSVSKENVRCKRCGDVSDFFIELNGRVFFRDDLIIPYNDVDNPFCK